MITKLILVASLIWLIPLMYYMNVNETKFKKNIVVGVTLPYHAREDEEVNQCLVRFKKEERLVCILMVLLGFSVFLVKSFTAYFTIWLIWIDLVCIVPEIPYVMCNGRLKKIKQEKGWHSGLPRVAKVNISHLSEGKILSPWVFVPAIAISVIPLFFDESLFAPTILMTVMTAASWAGYRYLYRYKSEMVDDNVDLTIALTRVRRQNWGKLWLVTGYSCALYSVAMWISMMHFYIGMIIFVAITVILCVVVFKVEFGVRKQQEQLTKDSGHTWYVDDDDKWIGGILYYNPDDSRLLINARVGTNSSFNLAHPAGKVIIVLTALLLAAMPFTGIFLEQMGKQDIILSVEDGDFSAKAGMSDYTIAVDAIKEVSILDELPDGFHRKVGSGLETLSKGTFGSDEYSKMKVILDPTVGPYLLIETNDGEFYLFGTHDGKEIEELYQALAN